MDSSLHPSRLFEYGPDDRVFDSLLVVGGALLVLIGVLGRNVITLTLGVGYVGTFLAHLLVKGLTA